MSSSLPVIDETMTQPRVLLVDDDEVNLLLTSIALRERGFVITEAASGERALELLRDWQPDVVVLDALMPGMDGFETCRELRLLATLASLPVLMLTGLDDEASINRAYEAGATDFFVKSNQWSLLDGRLRYLLRSSRTRLELELSQARLARAQDLARMGSFEWKVGSPEPVFSTEALRVFQFDPGTSLPFRDLLRMMPKEERRGKRALLSETLQSQGNLTRDIPLVLPDGQVHIIHTEASPEVNEHGQLVGYTGIVQDVTDRWNAEHKIRQLANFDSLTGLPNRNQLIERTERALDAARRMGHQVGLLVIDLDRFKVINDTLGHGAGDELLIEVARRLRSCVRHSDQVTDNLLDSMGTRAFRTLEAMCRLGGDEFVALLPEVIDEHDAEIVAARVLEQMRAPIHVAGQECFVTASVGIALFPRDGNDVAELIRNSDVAMFAVKAQGRNAATVYRPQLAGKGREKLELESALHKAIERNELVLYYQPKIDVRGARMVGVEALMRWQRGNVLVPPGEFIPLAEESGLIRPLSEWAIREAARQARVWLDAFGFADSIAVNLPSRMFDRGDLVEMIHEAVVSNGVPHHSLVLEITENSLMKDLQSVIPSLHRLNEIGVEISIDDFGTGYSSLAYLTTLPISELKIDRGFIRDLGMTPQSSAVVTAIIALARSLGLRVVAEGVENLRQMEVLHRLGCGVMQGFLFSKPRPADEIQAWLEDTVLPRTASWIGLATDEMSSDPSRNMASRPVRTPNNAS
jgi:predicted signal transduction protein with EAL and GGDEF domain/DNA-binding response OmpR family regulator